MKTRTQIQTLQRFASRVKRMRAVSSKEGSSPVTENSEISRTNDSYRPEIDGLRAVAVLSVMLSHAGIARFAGGFLGVDVFFVISGFLISGIILNDVDRGRFSIRMFYERRVRRILPAALLVTAVCLLPGWFFMSPDAYKNLGESVVATTLSANNILLTVTSGYWELESAFKPLLHTWSLGVEEQYYLFVPLIIALAYRCSTRRTIWAVGLISVVSFVLCIWAATRYPVANFYLLPTRAWELGVGGIAVILMRNRRLEPSSGALAFVGLAVIFLSVVFVPPETPTPSLIVSLPVAGTALVLVYCRTGAAYELLAFPPVRWIGLISYSAYLWHQPLFAYLRIISPNQPETWEFAALIPITLVLAWSSWRYVEEPFRNRKTMPFQTVARLLAPTAIVLIVVGAAIYKLGGIPSRLPLPAGAETPGSYKAYNAEAYKYKVDTFPANSDLNMLVLGNSQARDFINVMQAGNKFPNYSLVYRDHLNLCELDSLQASDAALIKNATLIVDVYDHMISSPVCDGHALAERPELKGKVIFVGPRDFGVNINPSSRVPLDQRANARVQASKEALDAEVYFRGRTPASLYISQLNDLTRDGHTMPIFDEHGLILTEDRLHLTRAGARFLAQRIFADPIWTQVESSARNRMGTAGRG